MKLIYTLSFHSLHREPDGVSQCHHGYVRRTHGILVVVCLWARTGVAKTSRLPLSPFTGYLTRPLRSCLPCLRVIKEPV